MLHPMGPDLSGTMLCYPQFGLGFGASRSTELHRSLLTKDEGQGTREEVKPEVSGLSRKLQSEKWGERGDEG